MTAENAPPARRPAGAGGASMRPRPMTAENANACKGWPMMPTRALQ